MATSFAALIYRPREVSDAMLAERFAVALAGWDVSSPVLQIAELRGAPGFEVAFYASGQRLPRGAEDEDFEHACELFEDELSPALAVLDAALEAGHDDARIYAMTYAEDLVHDDVWRFDAKGFERRYVREGEAGPEAGRETEGGAEELELDAHVDDDAAFARAARPLRGSTFLSNELGTPALPALMGALFALERRVPVRLSEPGARAIAVEVARLNAALKRRGGRGAFTVPEAVAGRATPEVFKAFVQAYDWEDPADPKDLYREVSLGAVDGTLRFLRAADLARLDGDAAWAERANEGLFPVAELLPQSLGAQPKKGTVLALARDDEALLLITEGRAPKPAGPTLAELVRYLALGWSSRTESEEDMIGALMLRARWRCDAAR